MVIFLLFKSQHEIDVILIIYLAGIYLDPSLLNQLERIKANLQISEENQGIVAINPKPAG